MTQQAAVLGRTQRFWAVKETTLGTYVHAAAGNEMRVLQSSFDYKVERRNRDDARNTRSLIERITAMEMVEWSAEMYVLPASAPPQGVLLEAALGNVSSLVYTPTDAQSPVSCTMVRMFDDVSATPTHLWQQIMVGAVVEKMTLKWGGGDFPKLSFSGKAVDLYETATTTLNGGVSATDTIVITDTDALEVGSIISVGSAFGTSNLGLRVATKSGTSCTLVNASDGSAANITQSNGAVVAPWMPAASALSNVGSPISMVDGSFSADGSTFYVTDGEIFVENEFKPITDEAFNSVIPGYIVGGRKVGGSVSCRMFKDQVKRLIRRKSFGSAGAATNKWALALTMGPATSNKRMTVTVPRPGVSSTGGAEVEFAAPNIPQSDEGIMQFPFVCLGSLSSAGVALLDEIEFKYH